MTGSTPLSADIKVSSSSPPSRSASRPRGSGAAVGQRGELQHTLPSSPAESRASPPGLPSPSSLFLLCRHLLPLLPSSHSPPLSPHPPTGAGVDRSRGDVSVRGGVPRGGRGQPVTPSGPGLGDVRGSSALPPDLGFEWLGVGVWGGAPADPAPSCSSFIGSPCGRVGGSWPLGGARSRSAAWHGPRPLGTSRMRAALPLGWHPAMVPSRAGCRRRRPLGAEFG